MSSDDVAKTVVVDAVVDDVAVGEGGKEISRRSTRRRKIVDRGGDDKVTEDDYDKSAEKTLANTSSRKLRRS